MNSVLKSLFVAIQIINKKGKIYIVQGKSSGTIGKKDRRMSDPLKKADLLIVFDPWENQNLIREAYRLNIPIIARVDKDDRSGQFLKYITYPLQFSGVEFFYTYIMLLYRLEKKRQTSKSLILAQNER